MAVAFLAMGLTRFRGIQEVGIICGGGLLLCLVPMMTTLPALLMLSRESERDYQIKGAGRARLQIERIWLQHPILVVVATMLICAAVLSQLGRVYFDYDLLRMQSPSLASVRSEYKLIRSSGRSAMSAAVIADSPQQAQVYETRIKALPAVSGVDSVARYLTEDQHRKLEAVHSLKNELADIQFASGDRRSVHIAELSATLWSLTGYLGLAAEAAEKNDPTLAAELRSFRERVIEFRKTLASDKPQVAGQLYQYQAALFEELWHTIEALKNQDASGPLRPQDLPGVMRDRFIGVTGKYLLQVNPRKDLWQHENQLELIQQLERVVPPEKVTGKPVQVYENTELLKRSYEQAAWYALMAIIVMLVLHFRSPGVVMLALLPVGIGSLWLLGFMGAFGVPFNPANIMILPLVVGIGVTNGIHILNRFAEEQRPDIFARSTGKAVLVSGLTAIAGFGTLILAKHQGIRSLGEVMSAGLFACMIAALTVLPAILSLLMRRPRAMQFVQEQVSFGF
jgi:predicted RND superfamily exporter protein